MSTKNSEEDLAHLKPLVDETSNGIKKNGVEDYERRYGTLGETDGKRNRGSSFRQVVAALFGSLGIINTGMMFGFSAVTIPQLKQPDSFIQITDDEASWIASLSSVTTPIGCFLSGYLLDSIGRKRTIILTMTPMIVGWFLISSAYTVHMIYVGRLFVGLGAGMMESPARVYTGEVAQPYLRGMLAAVASVGMSFGVMLQYVGGSFLSWNWLSFINGVIPTVGFVSAFFLPESPSWLLLKDQPEAALSALTSLRGSTCDVRAELQDLIDFSNKLKKENRKSSKLDTLHAVLHPSAIKPFVILVLFFIVYQFSGISPITFYAVEVIKESGSQLNSNLAIIILGVVRLVFTVVACILLRRCGRRPLTFLSSVICCATMYGLGSYMFLVQRWKEEGTESVATWFPAVTIYVFMAASTMGLATLPWVMIGELYPAKVRGIMGGMTTFVGHLFVFIAVKTFPFLQHVSKYGTFLLYGTSTLLGTIYLYVYLPETKGRTLQEIEDFFSGRTETLKPPKKVTTDNNNIIKV